MKVVDLKTFLAMPEGTIFAKGQPWYFCELSIKGESVGENDCWSLDPCWVAADDSEDAITRLRAMLEDGASFPMQDAWTRFGGLDAQDVFLIFEPDDLERLRTFIVGAINLAK